MAARGTHLPAVGSRFESAVEDLRDRVAAEPKPLELTEKQRAESDRRLDDQVANPDLRKSEIGQVDRACEAFGREPCFAFVVDAAQVMRVLIMSMERLLELRPPAKRTVGAK